MSVTEDCLDAFGAALTTAGAQREAIRHGQAPRIPPSLRHPAWPLRSGLELGALPTAVPCARLHARQVAWEWGLGALAETVELVVSEIVTNAIRASVIAAGDRRRLMEPAGVPIVRLRLATDRRRVLVQVWDGSPSKPQRQQPGPDVESGRGLLLIEALSTDWGTCSSAGSPGKIVWCMIAGPAWHDDQ